jgi:hypothetical protein
MALEEAMLLAQDKGWGCTDSCNVFVILLLSLKHLIKQSALAKSFLKTMLAPNLQPPSTRQAARPSQATLSCPPTADQLPIRVSVMPPLTYHYDTAGHLTDLVLRGLVFGGRSQDLSNDHMCLGSSEGVDDAHSLYFLGAMGNGHPDSRRVLYGVSEGSASQGGEEESGTG